MMRSSSDPLPGPVALAVLVCATAAPRAQQLLADLESPAASASSSAPNRAAVGATSLFFLGTTSLPPPITSLFRSDGTANGTVELDSNSFTLGAPEVVVGNTVYYRYSAPSIDQLRRYVWAGVPPLVLVDFDTSAIRAIEGKVGTRVLFSVANNGHGPEPWVTDGTATGTRMLKLISSNPPGPGSLYRGPTENQFLEFAARAWFPANDDVVGNELWITDGTTAGTVLFADLEPGPSGSDPHGFVTGGGRIWFLATTSARGTGIWSVDVARGAPTLLVPLMPGVASSTPEDLVYAGGLLYFRARDASGVPRIFSVDSATGVVQVASRWAEDPPSHLRWNRSAALGRDLVFLAEFPGRGPELWATSGTASSARRLLDVAPAGTLDPEPLFVEHQGALWFVAERPGFGAELHRTDATSAGTERVLDLHPAEGDGAVRVLASFGGQLYFAGDDGARGVELYRTDGDPAGTGLVADLYADPASLGSDPFLAPGSGPLFSAATAATGREPYVTDGTTAGTALLADLAPGSASSDPAGFRRVGSQVWFSADDGTRGREPYIADANGLRTFELVPGPAGSAPGGFVPVGSRVLFASRTAASPVIPRLLSSDGTLAGTRAIPGVGQVFRSPISLGGVALFTATPSMNPSDAELWISDGTTAGTRELVDIEPTGSGNPDLLTRAGRKVFFRAFQSTSGFELWVTDGTAAGTRLTRDIDPGASSTPQGLVAVGDRVYFFASAPGSGRELWVSDGTAAGTRLVADTVPGPAWPFRGALEIVASGERLFFVQDDGTHGEELWTSDGTSAGTRMVVDLVPGPTGSIARTAGVLAPVGSSGLVVFEATDAAGDTEPWISDGTAAGTGRLRDIDRVGSSAPAAPGSGGFVVWGRKILFSADDGYRGREPWILDVAELGQPLATSYGSACSTSGLGPFAGAATPPRLAGVLDVTLAGAAPQRPVFLLWGSDCDELSLGACSLLVRDPDVIGMTTTGTLGSTSLPLLLPNLPELLGGELFLQWAVDEPGGPLLGVVSLSDGLLAVLGR